MCDLLPEPARIRIKKFFYSEPIEVEEKNINTSIHKILKSKMPKWLKIYCIKLIILYNNIIILKIKTEIKISEHRLKKVNEKIINLKENFRIKF